MKRTLSYPILGYCTLTCLDHVNLDFVERASLLVRHTLCLLQDISTRDARNSPDIDTDQAIEDMPVKASQLSLFRRFSPLFNRQLALGKAFLVCLLEVLAPPAYISTTVSRASPIRSNKT